MLQRMTLRWLHLHNGALMAQCGFSLRNVTLMRPSPLMACRWMLLVLGTCTAHQEI